MGRSKDSDHFRIPASVRPEAEEIIKLTDEFCAAHLDAEYGELCLKLVAELARLGTGHQLELNCADSQAGLSNCRAR